MKKFSARPLLLTTAVLLSLPAYSTVYAQTAPATPAAAKTDKTQSADDVQKIREVIVTARRVGERIQDVPLSIVALTGQDLQERSITNLTELSTFTPGLSYSPDFGRSAERPVIRGISALRTEAPQPVSVFFNGVFVRDGALSLGIDDAQRIEVVKGPQSALYGRSTYAGAINYITVKPGNELEGRLSATVAGSGERSVFGAITIPFSPDVMSARLRAKSYQYGGSYTNSLTGTKIGKESSRSGGADVLFAPIKNLDAIFTVDMAQDRDGHFAAVARTVPVQAAGVITNPNNTTNIANGQTCNGRTLNIVGNNPATGFPDPAFPASLATRVNGWPCGAANLSGTTISRNTADFTNYTDPATGIGYGNIEGLDRDIIRSTATINYTFDNGMKLTSLTGVTRQKTNLGADQSYNGTRFAPGFGAPAASWLSYNRDALKYKSQEFRLASAEGSTITWLAGYFYYKEEFTGQGTGVIAQNAQLQTIADFLRPSSRSTIVSMAPFGRIQYAFNDKMKMSFEGRYGSEKVSVGGTALGRATVTVGTCAAGEICFINGDKTFKDFTPRVTFDYKMNKDSLLYAQFAKGSKSGGFNTTPGLSSGNFAYDGEKISSAEIGMKNDFANRTLRVNLAFFQNNVTGLQLSNISTVQSPFTGASATTTIVNNVGKARTRGLEAEVLWKTTKWLTLSGNYAYTDAKALEGTETTNGTAFGGDRSVNGAFLPRSPKHSAAGSIAIDLPLASTGLSWFARGDVVHQSRRYAEIQNLIWANPFTHVNLSAGVRTNDWRITVFAKNATNDDTSLNGFRYLDPATFRRTAVDFLPKLRQVGVTMAYDF